MREFPIVERRLLEHRLGQWKIFHLQKIASHAGGGSCSKRLVEVSIECRQLSRHAPFKGLSVS